MISEPTLRTIKVIHDVSNFFKLIPLQLNVKGLGIYGNFEIIYHGTYWKTVAGIQVVLRLILTGFAVNQLRKNSDEIMPLDVIIGIASIVLLLVSVVLVIFYTCLMEDVQQFLNMFFRINQHFCRTLNVKPVETDILKYVVILIVIVLTLLGLLLIPCNIIFVHYEPIPLFYGVGTNHIVTDLLVAAGIWYFMISGLVVFASFATYGFIYSLAMSKWLHHIRFNPATSKWQKEEYFLAYRSLQVHNVFWVELSNGLVAILLSLLSILSIAFLYTLVRMGFSYSDFSFLINIGIFMSFVITLTLLFIGGMFFFKFSLWLAINSINCWEFPLQGRTQLSKLEKAFYRSCRHISVYIGTVLPIHNPLVPLVFYSHMVVKPTIDLLLASP